jgi:Tfp pilus assembly protein FimV
VAAVLIPNEPSDRYERFARPVLRVVPCGPSVPDASAARSVRPVPVRRRRRSAAVYRRRRTACAGLIAGAGLVLWLIVHVLSGSPAPTIGSTTDVAAHVYVVQPGDTLWSIADQLEPNADIRPLVDALNAEVHGQPIQPGEQLTIP